MVQYVEILMVKVLYKTVNAIFLHKMCLLTVLVEYSGQNNW